jgi:hypothetical protein
MVLLAPVVGASRTRRSPAVGADGGPAAASPRVTETAPSSPTEPPCGTPSRFRTGTMARPPTHVRSCRCIRGRAPYHGSSFMQSIVEPGAVVGRGDRGA